MGLTVTPATLIPRPDTETLVDTALNRIPGEAKMRVADLGTGSGAVALALAAERPQIQVWGTDISNDALQVAQKNRSDLGLKNVVFFLVDRWFPDDPQLYDCIVSNPPYVASGHENLVSTEIAHEPKLALVAGPQGLDAIRDIIALAPGRLVAGGWLMLEHGFDQKDAVQDLMQKAGFTKIKTSKDLAGNDRVTEGCL